MSKSIVKQSLELFDKPSEGNETTKSKVKKRPLKGNLCNQKISKGLPIDKKYSGQTIDQIRKQHQRQKDRTEENLRKLNALSRKPLNKESTTSIFKRGTRSREEPEIVKPVEGTVFTEEDFAMFEREYVVD